MGNTRAMGRFSDLVSCNIKRLKRRVEKIPRPSFQDKIANSPSQRVGIGIFPPPMLFRMFESVNSSLRSFLVPL